MLQTRASDTSYRKRQKVSMVGSRETFSSSPESLPVDLAYAVNCYFDRRYGAVMRRDGSLTETIAGSLGVPLGIGEWITPSASTAVPFTRELLANFGGSEWRRKASGVWSSITDDSSTSFGTSRQTQFKQLGTRLFIAGGRLAKWPGGANDITRVGIPAHNAAPSVVVNAGAGAFSATVGYRYMFCFYNSTTGLESDWSPVSSSTGAFTNKLRVEVTTPTTAPAASAGVDKKRLYRTLDGGATYYLLSTENLATATYNDTTADSALTTAAAYLGYKSVPPSETYVLEAFANRFWCVDAANPFIIRFSEAYTGADVDLEYFPTNYYLIANFPVTALHVRPDRMLVFGPRSIGMITGGSLETFEFRDLAPGAGTLFPESVVSDGATTAFLSERGFAVLGDGGVEVISYEIQDELQPFLAGSYNSSLFVSGRYHQGIRQFLWSISAVGTNDAPWEVVGSGAIDEWETVGTGVVDVWEDVGGAGVASNSTRNLMYGWSKEQSTAERKKWHKYTFANFPDANEDGAYVTAMHFPHMGESALDPQQNKLYLSYYDGSAGKVVAAFDPDVSLDDGVGFVAEGLTGRIDPSQDGRFKRFFGIHFPSSWADPTSDGLCTLKYALDINDPMYQGFSGSLITITDATDTKTLPQGKGRHLNLFFTDTSTNRNKLLLSEFYVEYRMSKQREAR